MPTTPTRSRVLARCLACDAIHTAYELEDGRCSVIGRQGCACGSDDLTVIRDDRTHEEVVVGQ